MRLKWCQVSSLWSIMSIASGKGGSREERAPTEVKRKYCLILVVRRTDRRLSRKAGVTRSPTKLTMATKWQGIAMGCHCHHSTKCLKPASLDNWIRTSDVICRIEGPLVVDSKPSSWLGIPSGTRKAEP